jgi:hypothetical protein
MLRPLALGSAILSFLSAYCTNQTVGGTGMVAHPQADGSICNNNVECSSFTCSGGVCVAPPGGLIEIDGDCSGGGTCVGDATCQDDICVAGGSLACAADNTPCQTDSDCCNLICTNKVCSFGTTGVGGSTTTTTTCKAAGASCFTNGDCCTGGCDQATFPSVCSDTCGLQGSSCSLDSDCCTGVCASGTSACI